MIHLEKFVFIWVENDLELRYSVELLTDKKINKKKITMGRETRKKLLRDESTIWSFTANTIDMTKFRGIIYRYFLFDDVVEEYFGASSANPYKDLTYTTISEKNHYIRWFGRKEIDGAPLYQGQRQLQRWTCFYPDFNKQTYSYESNIEYLFVTKYYHEKRFDKNSFMYHLAHKLKILLCTDKIICAQQNFEIAGGLNPVQIEIEDDRVLNILKRHKNAVYRLTPLGI